MTYRNKDLLRQEMFLLTVDVYNNRSNTTCTFVRPLSLGTIKVHKEVHIIFKTIVSCVMKNTRRDEIFKKLHVMVKSLAIGFIV